MAQPSSLDPIFQGAGAQWNVDPDLLRAVAMTESGMRTTPDVVSSTGAQGIMQFMPSTAAQYGVRDPFDPNQAIPGAAHYISDLLHRAEAQGLSGPAAVSHALGGYYGKEDPKYIGTVARYYRQIAGAPSQAPLQGSPFDYTIGDSIAHGVQNLTGLPGDTLDGRSTAAVLATINNLAQNGGLQGKTVFLSSGASNSPQALDLVGQQIATLKQAGATPILAGVGSGVANYQTVNQQLAAIAKSAGVPFGGELAGTEGGRVHPRDYRMVLNQFAVTPTGSMAAPATSPPVGQDMSKMPDFINDPLVQQLISGQLKLPDIQSGAPGQPAPVPTGPQALAAASPANRPLMDPQNIARIITGTPGGMPGIIGSGNEAALGPLVTAMGQGLPREGMAQYAIDPSGQTVLRAIPGAPQAEADIHGARAGAEARAKLPLEMLLKQLETELANQNTIETHVINGQEVPMRRADWLRIAGQNPALSSALSPQPPTAGTPAPPANPGAPAAGGAPTLGVPAKTPETQGATEYEKLQAADLGKLRESFIGNQSAIQNLQNFLEAAQAAGTGKGTEFSAHTAAWLKSINIDPQKLGLADPAEVEKMHKAATQMIFSTIRGVSNRPAYQEFQMLAQGLPNADLQPEANRAIAAALLGKMQWENSLYKAWDGDRRQSHSAANFDLAGWTGANPMPSFQASAYAQTPQIPERQVVGSRTPAPQYHEGQTITNPQTKARMIFRGGQWVPMQ